MPNLQGKCKEKLNAIGYNLAVYGEKQAFFGGFPSRKHRVMIFCPAPHFAIAVAFMQQTVAQLPLTTLIRT